ncbi:hypothetical protein BCP78_0215 [Bacillus phage BCP78]|uniref:Uncharacterized protein n=3 Tax=Tsarbombavirus BCP78 TaxID=1985182 RepID=J9PS04_9CAUD|nr:hypothetical protein BCP78_0215 [Bacillus phage BCP78]YP_009783577.1 hypothetical protein QLX27_gp204 [Bacillus phage BCU4]AEW47222.1 hypothetical protein BCP78_0215 [Bacillus phage BCP78]AEW47710.1 hypothetical protein BCU4_0204 [Bacillus phage BCU4]AQN32589.1 hypothetical protein BCP12_189 [Bacillus phage BCP12]
MAKEEKNLEEVSVEKTESSDNKQVKKAKEVEPVKPYVHIDTFLQTAVQLYDINNMQKAGFKALMNGRHYQTDEMVFLNELKQYLDLK